MTKQNLLFKNLIICTQLIAAVMLFVSFAADSFAAELSIKEIEAYDYKPVSASIDTAHRAFARARINGTITKINVTEGADVKEGDVLAIITDQKQNSNIAAVSAKLAAMENERVQAAADVARYEPLEKMGAISKQRFEEIKTKLNVIENNIAAINAEKNSAVTNRSEGSVLAPMSGKVLSLPFNKGNVVMMGENIAELTAGDLILKIKVPERHSKFLKQGDKLRVGNIDVDGKFSDGVINKIYPSVENGYISADVSLNDLVNLFIGENLTAYIPTAKRKAIYIPLQYVTTRHGLNYVKTKSGEELVVELGLKDVNGIEVLSGLKEGDVLVTQ